jgi:hypothetical protein
MLINCSKSHLKPKKEVVPDLFEHDCTTFYQQQNVLMNNFYFCFMIKYHKLHNRV